MDRLATEEASATPPQNNGDNSRSDFMQQLSGFGSLASSTPARNGRNKNDDLKVTYRELTVEHGQSREVSIEARVNYRTVNPNFTTLPTIS